MGFSHNALQQPQAESGGAAGLHSPGTGSKFSIQGAVWTQQSRSLQDPSKHCPGPRLTEKPAQDGQECRILAEGVMVAATRLKVTIKTPRMTWMKPSTSRICSQVR